jgi:hypothetical protein
MWPEYGTTPEAPLIDRKDWPKLIAAFSSGPDFPFLPPTHDQDGIGECNCDDTTIGIESIRMTQGLPYVQLSAGDLYDRINGGVDEGSTLEDAMHEVITNGVGTAATCGAVWHPGMKTASAEERARFKVIEAFLCPTFEHCMSAVLCGFRLSSGVTWCSNYTPGADGWLPPGRSSVGGHAVFGYKPAIRKGQFGIWHKNSWGDSWGVGGGCCVFPESMYTDSIGGWWALRAVTDEGGIVPSPN